MLSKVARESVFANLLRPRVIWCLAILLLLPAGILRAQVSNTGQITGTVFDPSGKVISGAQVTVTNPATSFTQTVTASATGVYVLSELQPGTYVVSITASGFAKSVLNNVVVQVAQTTDLPIKMTVGGQAQTVTVSAETVVLQTTQSTLSTTISPELMENLPLNGRDVLEFATLAPGAANPGIHGNNYNTYNDLPNAALNISIGGTADQFQRYKTFSSSFWDVAPAREGAFEEATVSTAGLGAANGEAGSQIQFNVKSGTDHFHGRGVWQAENSFFNANSWTNNARGIPLPKSRNNFYGGNLGGPLLPKRLVGNHRVYFFVNLEYNKVPSAFSTTNNALTGDTSGPATDCTASGMGAANGCYTYEVSAIPAVRPAWVQGCDSGTMTCTANLAAPPNHRRSQTSSVGSPPITRMGRSSLSVIRQPRCRPTTRITSSSWSITLRSREPCGIPLRGWTWISLPRCTGAIRGTSKIARSRVTGTGPDRRMSATTLDSIILIIPGRIV